MNPGETSHLLDDVGRIYPMFRADEQRLRLWFQLLKDVGLEDSRRALLSYAKTHRWPPTPADIRERCASKTDDDPNPPKVFQCRTCGVAAAAYEGGDCFPCIAAERGA